MDALFLQMAIFQCTWARSTAASQQTPQQFHWHHAELQLLNLKFFKTLNNQHNLHNKILLCSLRLLISLSDLMGEWGVKNLALRKEASLRLISPFWKENGCENIMKHLCQLGSSSSYTQTLSSLCAQTARLHMYCVNWFFAAHSTEKVEMLRIHVFTLN